MRGRGVSEGGLTTCLPFQSFPPGWNKSKEETKRKEQDEHTAIRKGRGRDRGKAEIHTCDGEAT